MIRSREVRKRARELLSMAGVTEPPVNVNALAEFLGFTILPFEFPESTSAMIFIEGDVKTIGVNSLHSITRQRFSVAHELGHYLSGHEAYDQGKTYVEGLPKFLDPQNRQEFEANEFAAEMLMPEPFLRQDLAEQGLNVPALAKRYQVSEQAMWIQLIDLKLATQYSKG